MQGQTEKQTLAGLFRTIAFLTLFFAISKSDAKIRSDMYGGIRYSDFVISWSIYRKKRWQISVVVSRNRLAEISAARPPKQGKCPENEVEGLQQAAMSSSLYELRLQGIMGVVLIILESDWKCDLKNTTTMTPFKHIS